MAATERKQTGIIEQWAVKVTGYSSQYDSNNWGAVSVIGQPRVYPQYGDIPGAWAQGNCSQNEYIQLLYDTPVHVTAINIYETLNAGGVRRVCVRSPENTWDTLWETSKVQHISRSRIFSPDIQVPPYKTNEIRLDIDCSGSGSWVEIDSVQLVGRKHKIDPPPSLQALSDDLLKLVNDKEFSDVCFNVGGTVVFGHRAILAARSPVFRQTMECSFTEGFMLLTEIVIEKMEAEVFKAVLRYIYSGDISCHHPLSTMVDVWRAAKRFDVVGLQLLCVARVDQQLTVENVLDVFTRASSSDPIADDIREVCLEFVSDNLKNVCASAEFKNLPHDLMIDLIQLSTSKLSLK